MGLLDKIRQDAVAARRAKDPKASVLVTLIGEADTGAKAMKERGRSKTPRSWPSSGSSSRTSMRP